MTISDQLAAIAPRQFYTDLRVKLGAILAALQAEECTIQGSILTSVSGVLIKVDVVSSTNVHISVGANESGEPLYQWVAPITWVTT